MRELRRIGRILYKLGKLWVKHPDMRFGQLLINYVGLDDTPNNWRREDDDWEKGLDWALKTK